MDVYGEWTVPGYRHVRRLGEGTSGLVIQAEHVETGTPVAIKYLNPQLTADEEFLTRFRGEAALIGGLTDSNIVRLHEYVETQSGAAIVMELVDGVSLAQLIGSDGATEPEAALFVLKGSLLALAAAHERGLVHRDFKPGNVLIDRNGQSRLTDFGIAVRAGGNEPSPGTPAYMPPEQWSGRPVIPASDMYAATAAFYECLTGHLPYPAQTLPQLAQAHRTSVIPVTFVPGPLHQLVKHGMAKDSHQRPASAAAFLSELEVIAFTAYGISWEERGRSQLMERAAAQALLSHQQAAYPAVDAAEGTMAVSEPGDGDDWYDDDPGTDRRTGFIVAAVALAVVMIVGGGAIVLAVSGGSPAAAGSKTPAPTTIDSGNPSADPSIQIPPSVSPRTSPSPTKSKSKSPTPTPTPTPSKTQVPTPKPTPFQVTGVTVYLNARNITRSDFFGRPTEGASGLTVRVTTRGGPVQPVRLSIGLSGVSGPNSLTVRSPSFTGSATVSGDPCAAWTVTATAPNGTSNSSTLNPDRKCN
ncbi:MAG: prkC11 [Actinomycetia bacterium]|nr:prkC11 [Actinomycetes bacterium]